MAEFYFAPTTNFWSTTLNGTIDSSASTITLTTTSGLQSPGVVIINREDGLNNATPNAREVIAYTGISGNDLTGCVRGYDNSTARSHTTGSLVESVFTVGQWNDLVTSVKTAFNNNIAGTQVNIANATITSLANINTIRSNFGQYSAATIGILKITGHLNTSGASITGFTTSDPLVLNNLAVASTASIFLADIKSLAVSSVASISLLGRHRKLVFQKTTGTSLVTIASSYVDLLSLSVSATDNPQPGVLRVSAGSNMWGGTVGGRGALGIRVDGSANSAYDTTNEIAIAGFGTGESLTTNAKSLAGTAYISVASGARTVYLVARTQDGLNARAQDCYLQLEALGS